MQQRVSMFLISRSRQNLIHTCFDERRYERPPETAACA
jgi:hypothetical protein